MKAEHPDWLIKAWHRFGYWNFANPEVRDYRARILREMADLMGVTQHTVQVRWCSNARIEAEKDPATGHGRISGHEYERLRRGRKPRAP